MQCRRFGSHRVWEAPFHARQSTRINVLHRCGRRRILPRLRFPVCAPYLLHATAGLLTASTNTVNSIRSTRAAAMSIIVRDQRAGDAAVLPTSVVTQIPKSATTGARALGNKQCKDAPRRYHRCSGHQLFETLG
ncbi:hypothetical protein KCP69_04765 [Salmonella enterica subsp. enterica]|nr:hypothetical protein KCP69_04765 [Salmonella enterica subsp. enterica]